MKCLANWPLSGENSHFPNYRGFEMDVFSVVKDFFVGLRVPLCTYELYDIFVSAPIVPTKHANPYHLHDFTQAQVERMFTDRGWWIDRRVDQPEELSMMWVFRRG